MPSQLMSFSKSQGNTTELRLSSCPRRTSQVTHPHPTAEAQAGKVRAGRPRGVRNSSGYRDWLELGLLLSS